MKTTKILILAMLAMCSIKLSAGTNFAWAKQMGGTNSETGKDVIVDGDKNTYTIGNFTGTVDFNPGTGVYNLTSAGFNDIFIQKLNASGNFVWAKRIGSTGYDNACSIAFCDGGIIITGSFEGTVDFDPYTGVYNLTSAGGYDAFILKLNSSGSFCWAKKAGGTGMDVATSSVREGYPDYTGAIYITGYFSSTVDFNPGTGVYNLSSAGGFDIFVLKLDASGNFTWARRIGSTGDDVANDIDYGYEHLYYLAYWKYHKEIILTGYFNGTVDFNPGSGTNNYTSAGGPDIFVLSLDLNANYQWAYRVGGTGSDAGKSIHLISGCGWGNIGWSTNMLICLTGYFQNTVDFNSGTGTYNLTSAGGNDIFVMNTATEVGNDLFFGAIRVGGTGDDKGISICGDGNSNYVTGYFNGTVDFDPGTGIKNITSNGGRDIFIIECCPGYGAIWNVCCIGGTGDDEGECVTKDGGNIYTTGSFRNSITIPFDEYCYIMTSKGASDAYLFKLNFDYGLNLKKEELSAVSTNDDNNINKEMSLNIYPNPTSGNLTIDLGTEQENVEVKILNISGQIVYNQKYESTGTINYNIEGPAGIYFVNVISGDGKMQTRKIVKQ